MCRDLSTAPRAASGSLTYVFGQAGGSIAVLRRSEVLAGSHDKALAGNLLSWGLLVNVTAVRGQCSSSTQPLPQLVRPVNVSLGSLKERSCLHCAYR